MHAHIQTLPIKLRSVSRGSKLSAETPRLLGGREKREREDGRNKEREEGREKREGGR